jgi:hypothetical protein
LLRHAARGPPGRGLRPGTGFRDRFGQASPGAVAGPGTVALGIRPGSAVIAGRLLRRGDIRHQRDIRGRHDRDRLRPLVGIVECPAGRALPIQSRRAPDTDRPLPDRYALVLGDRPARCSAGGRRLAWLPPSAHCPIAPAAWPPIASRTAPTGTAPTGTVSLPRQRRQPGQLAVGPVCPDALPRPGSGQRHRFARGARPGTVISLVLLGQPARPAGAGHTNPTRESPQRGSPAERGHCPAQGPWRHGQAGLALGSACVLSHRRSPHRLGDSKSAGQGNVIGPHARRC